MFGSLDRCLPHTLRHQIERYNAALATAIAGSGDMLLDVAALAQSVGLAAWHSPGEWHMARMPFATRCTPLYADHVARLIGAMRGKARRCLVLDLDNTLWGGVIGDDGLSGIRVGQGDPVGESFLALQQFALDLHGRGVVLAVSSKNEDAIARSALRDHPDMLLREAHFAVFQANWTDKPANIRAIADELSLGLSSFVFVDDNPVERAMVRDLLPEVAVPEMPDDPALFARTLSAAGYFEAIAYSAEDETRAAFYRDNAQRLHLQQASDGLGAYLESLRMEIAFAPFDAPGRDRIVQLINKSNQFNLTTRRYSSTEIAGLEVDPDVLTLQVRLRDRFGDNGMICVVIARRMTADTWEIDSWLMSCRVLGRQVEEAVLSELCRCARDRKIDWLIGIFRRTNRNMIVSEHYCKLGFEEIEASADGETRWRLRTDARIRPAPMTIINRDGTNSG